MSIGTVGAIVGIASGVNSIANSGGGSNGVQAQQQNPGQTAQQILQAEQQAAPGMYSSTAQYAPMYNQLQQGMLGQTASSMLQGFGAATPQLQQMQNYANMGQGMGQLNQLGILAPSMVSQYQAANPQLQALQQQYTNLAQSNPNPVGQISGAGGWGQGYVNGVSQAVNGAQVQTPMAQSTAGMLAGYNPNVSMVSPQMQVRNQNVQAQGNSTLNQLNQTAQQQLAMGTSVSPQEQATVANQVLSNYNQMGRANDPTAIAGLATGLDTYGQQLLQSREGAASTAAGLTTSQGGLNLAGQQSNQAANLQAQTTNLGASQQSQLANQSALLQGSGLGLSALSTAAGLGQQANLANQSASLTAQQANLQSQLGLGALQYQGLYGSGQQSLAASQANQQAQLMNAQYQQSLLGGASQLAFNTANPAMSYLMGQQSGAIGQAAGLTQMAGNTVTAGNQLSSMFNPFTSGAFNSVYGAQSGTNQFNAATNQGMLGGAMSMLGSSSAMGAMSGWGSSMGNFFSGLGGGGDTYNAPGQDYSSD